MTVKITSNQRIACLFLGSVFLWGALGLIISNFYSGLVQVTVSTVHGGPYSLTLMPNEDILDITIAFALISSIFFAIGFGSELTHVEYQKKEEQTKPSQA